MSRSDTTDLPEVLILGCERTGKTLTLRRLVHRLHDRDEDISIETKSTTGVEVDTLTLGGMEVRVREVGAPMIPLWPKYYANCAALIFLADLSQPSQASASSVEFLEVVAHPLMRGKPILLVLHKTDEAFRMASDTLRELFHVEDLRRDPTVHLVVLEASARSGHGFDEMTAWVHDSLARHRATSAARAAAAAAPATSAGTGGGSSGSSSGGGGGGGSAK